VQESPCQARFKKGEHDKIAGINASQIAGKNSVSVTIYYFMQPRITGQNEAFKAENIVN
jgi:hypothetical protein